MPRPQELKEWASSPEAKHFRTVLQDQLDDATAGFIAGEFDRETLNETAITLLRVQAGMRTVQKVLATLDEMASWEPESKEKAEGESNAY